MEMQKLPLSSSLLLNLMLYTGKMLSGAAPDGEPEGKQSWRLFPEAFYSVHQREDRLSDYTWLITPFISETPHPKSLAMMMCTPGYSPALLLTCSVSSSKIPLSHNQPEIRLLVLPSAANPYALLGRILFLVRIHTVGCCNPGAVAGLCTAARWFSGGVLRFGFHSENCKWPFCWKHQLRCS